MLCEDTRHSKGLLDRHGIQAKLLSYHRTTRLQRTAELLPRLAGRRADRARLRRRPARGQRSWRPADPGGARGGGARDRAARALGRRDGARRERACGRALPVPRLPAARSEGARGASGRSCASSPHPAVAFESPQAAAGDAPLARGDALPDRPVAVCRELTKRFEEVVRGPARDVAARFAERAEGRDHARGRRHGAAASKAPPRARRSRPWASSSRRACPGVRRPTWSPGSREFPVTPSMRNR